MTEIARQLETFDVAFEEAQQEFGGRIATTENGLATVVQGDGLDVLQDGPVDQVGFRRIELPVSQYLQTPQILGRVVLMKNEQLQQMFPAVLMPSPQDPHKVRVTRLKDPFVPSPEAGLTPGLHFGISVHAQTQTASFGEHTAAGGFEAGHFGVALTTDRSQKIAQKLMQKGDHATHEVLQPGLPNVMQQLDMFTVTDQPDITDLDPATLPNGYTLPLYWHPSLEGKNGAIAADYPDATKKLLGAGIKRIGQAGLDRVGNFIEHTVRGAR